jgi:hypothetical protein
MKLRIRGNSVRVRLTKSEVAQLETKGVVEDAVHLGGSSLPFSYCVRTAPEDAVSAAFDGERMSVSIPLDVASHWAGSDQIGIDAIQPVGEDDNVRILVEKDFACLTERKDEDESDAYPNPSKVAMC